MPLTALTSVGDIDAGTHVRFLIAPRVFIFARISLVTLQLTQSQPHGNTISAWITVVTIGSRDEMTFSKHQKKHEQPGIVF